ncbi:MAG: YibE/F family protein [Eubacteriales bacterium]|nr:YibE/F family protein [Eubacteriales bacterium]
MSDKKKFIIRLMIIVAGLAVFFIAAGRLRVVDKEEIVTTTGYTYEDAKVVEIVEDNLTEDGVRVGYQHIRIKLLSGDYKGRIVDATSAEGNLFGAVCKEGDRVIVHMSASGNTMNVSVYSKDRVVQIAIFVSVFLLLMCLIGGKNGVKSVAGLVFTFLSIFMIYIPMIYRGYSPFWAAVLITIITTIVTMYLISGATIKTFCAITGTVIGVLLAGLSAWLFGLWADIDGYNVSNIETLAFVGQLTKIRIGGLLFSGILISSLGAVMDVAMSVSSAIYEIHCKAPDLGRMELFKSGMNVGRDMMGTMSNTLILAYVGSAVSTLVINYAYDLPFRQIINSYNIGIEIMQGVAGSIGVILTVPCVAVITSCLLKRRPR